MVKVCDYWDNFLKFDQTNYKYFYHELQVEFRKLKRRQHHFTEIIKITIFDSLIKSNFVFIRNHAHRTSLQRYTTINDRLYKLIDINLQNINNGHNEIVSIHSLKKAFITKDFKPTPIVEENLRNRVQHRGDLCSGLLHYIS